LKSQSSSPLLPGADADAAREWRLCSQLLNHQLALQGNNPGWYCQSFNPYPFGVDADHLRLQHNLQRELHAVIKIIVRNYFIDKRLQQLISLSKPATSLLKFIESREPQYAVGSYRPDFLHALDDHIQICEINARFPLNAYLISYYLNQAVGQLSAMHSNFLQGPAALDQILNRLLCRFAPGAKVCLWKGRERGWDIHFFNYELKRLGFEIVPVNGKPDGLVMELNQDEILSDSNHNRLVELIETVPQRFWLNDLRTIFLVHDKRFLALFQRHDILRDYLCEAQIKLLARHVVPTFVLGRSPQQREQALSNPGAWLLKPNLLGKGEGILFGGNMSAAAWRAALTSTSHEHYVLQSVVQQKRFSLMQPQNGSPAIIGMHVVGTLLCLDDYFFGPGIYRASCGDIVNVAGGGTILFPVLSTPSA